MSLLACTTLAYAGPLRMRPGASARVVAAPAGLGAAHELLMREPRAHQLDRHRPAVQDAGVDFNGAHGPAGHELPVERARLLRTE